MKPFLSILTRCFKRPRQLERCIASIQNQTDQDFEHLLISDYEGRGLHWTNSQIHENRYRVNGEWIYVLDDDDYLIDLSFIKKLKEINKIINAGIIICKGYIDKKLYPPDNFWKRNPLRGTIGSPNFIVKKKIFLKYSSKWCEKKAGDYFFIKKAYEHTKVYWWNRIIFQASIGNGFPEESEFTKGIQEEFIELQEKHDRYQNSIHA